MQEKTIKAIIVKKFNQWLDSITDDEVKKVVKSGAIVSGGCITSLLLNEKPNDFDIYFKDKDTLLKVCHYYAMKFNERHPFMTNKLGKTIECLVLDGALIEKKENGTFTINDAKINSYIDAQKKIEDGKPVLSDGKHDGTFTGFSRMFANCTPDRIKMIIMSDGVAGALPSDNDDVNAQDILEELDDMDAQVAEDDVKTKYNPVYITTNAITLSDKVQIVVRFYGEPKDIHENYDYEHTKAYWSSWNNELCIPKSVYECVMNKTLRYTGSKYPICSVFRMRKFIERGWKINAGQILKMAFHINQLNLHDIDVLEEQLIGVDSVYFNELVHQVRKQMHDDPDFAWDFGYIVSIVDKIF